MKDTFLVVVCFVLVSFTQKSEEKLIGKWQLKKIEIAGQTVSPTKVKYFVEFSHDSLKYNLAVNHCWTSELKVDSNTIACKDIVTTLICCDEREDSLSKYIDYRGTYEIKDGLLVITNRKGIFYLYKTKKN